MPTDYSTAFTKNLNGMDVGLTTPASPWVLSPKSNTKTTVAPEVVDIQGDRIKINGQPVSGIPDVPTYNGQLGMWVWTQKPWKPVNGNVNGKSYQNGILSSGAAANDPSSLYTAMNIEKTPGLGGSADNLITAFNKGAKQNMDGFDDYLNRFKSAANTAISRSQDATDLGPITAALTGNQGRYSALLDSDAGGYAGVLDRSRAAEGDIVNRAYQNLGQYNAAMDREAALVDADTTNYLSRFGTQKNAGAGGAVMGLGSDVAKINADARYRAQLPIDLAKIDRGYQILTGLETPLEQGQTARDIAFQGSFLPTIHGAQYSSFADTAKYLQSLKAAAAQQDWETAQRILAIPGMAAAARNGILAGDAQLGQLLNAYYSSTHYQGLNYGPGASISPVLGYNNLTGGYPSYPRQNAGMPDFGVGPRQYGGPGGGGVGGGGDAYGGLPVFDEATGMLVNSQTRQPISRFSSSRLLPQEPYNPSVGPSDQSNSYYDPQTGLTFDRTTGAITGGNGNLDWNGINISEGD